MYINPQLAAAAVDMKQCFSKRRYIISDHVSTVLVNLTSTTGLSSWP